MTATPINALKIITYNKKHTNNTRIYISPNPFVVSSFLYFHFLDYISNFHNSYFIYLVYFVYFVYLVYFVYFAYFGSFIFYVIRNSGTMLSFAAFMCFISCVGAVAVVSEPPVRRQKGMSLKLDSSLERKGGGGESGKTDVATDKGAADAVSKTDKELRPLQKGQNIKYTHYTKYRTK